MTLIPTCESYVWIEEQYEGYIRYISTHHETENKRWEVFGVCNNCGKCWEGAVGPKPELDCPVNEKFHPEDYEGCPLSIKVINY